MNELTLPWLQAHEPFPNPASALGPESPWPGLLAAGGVLDAPTLLAAYSQGIFPWSGPDEPLLWWSTDPRMVLHPQHFRLHRSLRKTLCAFVRNPQASIRINSAFDEVLHQCATSPRPGQSGSWITDDIMLSYGELHRQGFAHSVETWVNGQLVGGLYLVALGQAVFGESMFAHQTDASKIALAALVCLCRAHGVELIDCQQQTAHLASLGARPIAQAEFLESIQRTQQRPAMRWHFEPAMWAQLLPTLNKS